MGRVYTVVGALWGDEGKGKFVDYICDKYRVDTSVRFNGGSNAGHSVHTKEHGTMQFRILPAGIVRPDSTAVLGNGMVIDPNYLMKELEMVEKVNPNFSLLIDQGAHIVFPIHSAIDGAKDDTRSKSGEESIGTTRSGNGPAYSDKALRVGVRMETLLDSEDEMRKAITTLVRSHGGNQNEVDRSMELAKVWKDKFASMIGDGSHYINNVIDGGDSVVFAGAQGVLLDIDHGTYPFVTSSPCTPAGVGIGAGVDPRRVDTVVGVVKAYSTRIGEGPMPTEIKCEETTEKIRKAGNEYEIGVHINRPRRIGWLDAVGLRKSAKISGYDCLAITLLDALTGIDRIEIPGVGSFSGWMKDISMCTSVDQLPWSMLAYIRTIEKIADTRVGFISTGPRRDQVIDLRSDWK